MNSKIIIILFIMNYSNIQCLNEDKFGKHLLNLFFLDPTYVNINHGSYGSPPKEVIQKLRQYQEEMDFNPDKWIRFILPERIKEIRIMVANYINSDIEGLVLVENASDGINSVFKSILGKGDKILFFDIAYTSAKNCAKFLKESIGVEILIVDLNEDTLNDDEKIIQKMEEVIKSNNPIKLASIDHIASIPAVKLPVEKIIKLLRNYNIASFIDGAHAVGQINLDIRNLQPDFYVSNFHKWGYNPKSASFLYVSESFRNKIHPNIISNGYGKGFTEEFAYTGTKDYSSILTIKDSLIFRQKYGEIDMMNYLENLSVAAGTTVAKIWKTDLLIKDQTKFTFMVNVRVPSDDETLLKKAQESLFKNYNTFMVIYKFSNGMYYARFSVQIYNEINDYIYAAENFLKLLNDNF